MTHTLHHRLYEQLIGPQTVEQHHVEALTQITRILGPVRWVDELIDRTAQCLSDIFSADAAVLMLQDPQHRRLWTQTGPWRKRSVIDDQEGLCGHVFQTHESVHIDDAAKSMLASQKIDPQNDVDGGSIMAVPVFGQQVLCLGVLKVTDERCGCFTQGDMTLLGAIAMTVGISLDNVRQFEALDRQFDSFVVSISRAIDARDAVTKYNSINVANYATGIGIHLGLKPNKLAALRLAGLLHDVGKIGTPDRILTKAGRLDRLEFEEVKKHAMYTRRMLKQVEFIQTYDEVCDIASDHHEKLDGSGYPDGLAGNQIPLSARILVVADMFHALTQPRHYRQGMAWSAAITILDDLTPHQLDNRCVEALKDFLGMGDSPAPAA